MEAAIQEFGRTVRYAVGSNERTVRFAILMLIAIIAWQVML